MGEARSQRALWVILGQGLESDREQQGECREDLSRGMTCENLLRNFVPGKQLALNKCELSILFCHHLAWYSKTSLPTTPSPEPSHLLPPSFHSSPQLRLRSTDPNMPVLSRRTGPGQARWGPLLPRHRKLGLVYGEGVHLCPFQPPPPSMASLQKSPRHTHKHTPPQAGLE